jgi:hypothetical protein
MAFLNPVERRRRRPIPAARHQHRAAPGALLIWNNADPDGVPNPWTIHAGMPVVRGVKYIITKWYRTRRVVLSSADGHSSPYPPTRESGQGRLRRIGRKVRRGSRQQGRQAHRGRRRPSCGRCRTSSIRSNAAG